MSKKDKFQQLQQNGGLLTSFQDIATNVAAVEKQVSTSLSKPEDVEPSPQSVAPSANETTLPDSDTSRYTHLPNPRISIREYNLASLYCSRFENMTRQDFVELAIIEKLHNDGQMPDEEFAARQSEIRNRPKRGKRKKTNN